MFLPYKKSNHMANQTFQIGDVVKLKSGSRWMTVYSIDGEYLECVYFFEGKYCYSGTLPSLLFTLEDVNI